MMFWITLLIMVISTIATALLTPRPEYENAKPTALGDIQIPTATEGRAIPLLWGRAKLAGPNVLWYGNYKHEAVTHEDDDELIIGYWYYITLQFGLCRGPIDRLHGIWVNDKYRAISLGSGGSGYISWHNLYGGWENGNGGIAGYLRLRSGTDDQPVDQWLNHHISDLPAYRGLAYCVFSKEDNAVDSSPAYIGKSASLTPWAFDLRRIPDGLNMAILNPGSEAPNDYDANPANVIYELLTDSDWGIGVDPASVDIANFQEVANTLYDEGNGFSMILDSERPITQILEEVQRQIDGMVFFNRGMGLWQIKLARDDYDAGTLPTFDESNITTLESFSRKTWEDTVNQVHIEFVDRDENYKSTYAMAQDSANVSIQGQRIRSTLRFPGVKNGALADKIAWRELKALSYPLASISFKINRTAFDQLPGSLFKFSWGPLGIIEEIYRVSSISHGTSDDGRIVIQAIQDIFSTGAAVYGPPPSTGWTAPDTTPAPIVSVDTFMAETPRQVSVAASRYPGLNPRAWFGARWPGGGTVTYRAYLKPGTLPRPLSYDYLSDTAVAKFLLVGSLTNDIDPYGTSAARPDASYDIDVTEVDSLGAIAVDGGPANVQSLLNVVYVDGEYIGFELAEDQTTHWRLARLYRGLFHTAPKAHSAGARVWFLGQGHGLSRTSLASNVNAVDVQLRSVGDEELEEGDCVVEQLDFQDLFNVPLAPRDPELHGAYAPSSGSLDVDCIVGRTGEDAKGLQAEVTPRDWQVDDMLADATLTGGWSGKHKFTLVMDPAGGAVDVGPYEAVDLPAEQFVKRNDVIKAMGTSAMPATAQLQVEALHTPDTTEIANPVLMEFDFTVVSTLIGQALRHGTLITGSGASVQYNETGTYTFDIGTVVLPSNALVEGRINAGSWVTVIAANNLTGTLAVVTDDLVELRISGLPADDQFISVTGPTSETGYGVMGA